MELLSPSPSPDRQAAVDVLLLLADEDARACDYRGAVRLLDHAEEAGRELPPEYRRKRERWSRLRDVRDGLAV
jgi:hypothetical protein